MVIGNNSTYFYFYLGNVGFDLVFPLLACKQALRDRGELASQPFHDVFFFSFLYFYTLLFIV